jgi:hypothetical protein
MFQINKFEEMEGTLGERAAWELFQAIQHLRRAALFYSGTVITPVILEQHKEVKQLLSLIDYNYNGEEEQQDEQE